MRGEAEELFHQIVKVRKQAMTELLDLMFNAKDATRLLDRERQKFKFDAQVDYNNLIECLRLVNVMNRGIQSVLGYAHERDEAIRQYRALIAPEIEKQQSFSTAPTPLPSQSRQPFGSRLASLRKSFQYRTWCQFLKLRKGSKKERIGLIGYRLLFGRRATRRFLLWLRRAQRVQQFSRNRDTRW